MGIHIPPIVAALLTVAFIVFLFRRDIREKPDISGALWLPLIWLVIGCSKGLSLWLITFGLPVSGAPSVEEGSPLDAAFLFALIAAAFYVLSKRQVRLSEIARHNGWVIVFFLYCFISIVWSDFPFVAFKRWIKILGHPIMTLIVLTEPDPEEAIVRLMKRCAYVVIPVSLLFIKYYPDLGCEYDPWTGGRTITGVAENKNVLGADCMILGFFFFWHLLQTWRTARDSWRRNELRLIAGFAIGIWWLLSRAHSATASISLLIGALIVMFVGIRFINKNFIGTYLLAALVLVAAAQLEFGILGGLSESLGRESSMSGRTVLWGRLLAIDINPILGTGFESFWLGKRPQQLEGLFYFIPNEAHNGYLEIYLNLGLVGLFILIALFIATFWKIRPGFWRDFEWSRFRLGFLGLVVLYNWTEAPFKTVSATFFVFNIIAMDYPKRKCESLVESCGALEENAELAYAPGREDLGLIGS